MTNSSAHPHAGQVSFDFRIGFTQDMAPCSKKRTQLKIMAFMLPTTQYTMQSDHLYNLTTELNAMCELFAMSSKSPSTVNYSLDEFARHGGVTYSNRSGWGIAYFQDRDAFLIKEPEPAADSPWVRLIAEENLQSDAVIAHVRLATIGTPALQNTHPFKRELGGHAHVFAHNGTLKGLHDNVSAAALAYYPIGDTDSELAYCILLDRLKMIWTGPRKIPSVTERLGIFADFAAEMASYGSANFLYSDGDTLFVHGHRRVHERGGEFSDPEPPGLNMRDCMVCQSEPECAYDGLKITLQNQQTVLFASVPLDDEGWEPLPEGTAIAVRRGQEIERRSTLT